MTAGSPVLFGLNVHPGVADLDVALKLAQLAETHEIDLLTIQDHPYIADFFDTWALLAFLAARTTRVRLGTNVSPVPLRPPAMLAKLAASLDLMSGGRIELGIGAGAFLQGILAMGGWTPEEPAERVRMFEEAITLIRALWESERPVTWAGRYVQVRGLRFGPRPARRPRIWVGATRPRMLRLVGRLADGLLVSNTYVPEHQLEQIHAAVDAGAAEAGRPPGAIRRGYNLMGVLKLAGPDPVTAEIRPGAPVLSAEQWTAELVRLYRERRIDTMIFWPLGRRPLDQAAVFAAEVVPAARAALASG